MEEGGSCVRDLPRFHTWLMGWIAIPPTKLENLGESADLSGGGVQSRGKERKEMIN